MPPKGGRKRKPPTVQHNEPSDDKASVSPPNRATWPGWVEMESEPAFFNVMLKEMLVEGIRVQEVLGLDEEMLAILPRPIHALIFLFRYKDTDQAVQHESADCPKHIWFANQIPDFACATVALLNIVNNIQGLRVGEQLQTFRDFTASMDPISRGDAIDSFDFIRQIHNSFARETDILVADMHVKEKAARMKRSKAVAKARQSREAKKAECTPLKRKSADSALVPTRKSARKQGLREETPHAKSTRSGESSPLSEAPDSDPDFETTWRGKAAAPTRESKEPSRRSNRTPKPRQDLVASSVTEEVGDEGFHFVAYMPIQGHVWKLDGLDSFPQDMGACDSDPSGEWIDVVQPALQTRMAMYEGADIEFNLMAVVDDPALKNRTELAHNVKLLQAIESALDGKSAGWRDLPQAATRDHVIKGPCIDLNISQNDIDAADNNGSTASKSEQGQDVEHLLQLRQDTLGAQAPLRGSVRDALESSRSDNESAQQRRHDYSAFIRSWLGALVEHEVLGGLLDDG